MRLGVLPSTFSVAYTGSQEATNGSEDDTEKGPKEGLVIMGDFLVV
jgi:hypothetical protein